MKEDVCYALHTVKDLVTPKKCYSLHAFLDKAANIFMTGVSQLKLSSEEYQEYPRLKSPGQAPSFTHSILSKACISQTLVSNFMNN